ncbi:MAG: hypothetical protein LQ350_004946 [Teloschistes chrysophthalmus]|nr:MAG: hypothetical protein LQ350_004946 [Niorma chrysophthalma]
MPFIPHTPEALLARSDSKDAATTCKGITDSGRPCRRGLASRKMTDGVVAVVANQNTNGDGAAAFFCWQHKDQASRLAPQSGPDQGANVYSLKTRTSTDTLIQRLGILNVEEKVRRPTRRKTKIDPRIASKEGLPPRWQEVPGPLLAVPSMKASGAPHPSQRKRRPHPLLSFLCCSGPEDADDYHPVAAKPRPKPSPHPEMHQTAAIPSHLPQPPQSSHRRDNHQSSSSARPALAPKSTNSRTRPPHPRDPSSQTSNLLALIPKTLSPQVTSQLLAELAKPVSPHDEEGYIYMFWLTPTGASTSATAQDPSSLLAAPSPNPSPRARRTSSTTAVVPGRTSLSPQPPTPSAGAQTILLKIGRASNVQRRMNEWTRQCGYDLSLIRYYPYIPSSSSSSSPLPSPSSKDTAPTGAGSGAGSGAPRKVPHAHKVERLIHLELQERRVKRECGNCGKEHREWFEVRGDREGVKGVDEVVRRWVGWAEGGGG